MSATLAGIRLHDLHLVADNLSAIQTLTTALMQSLARPNALPGAPVAFDRRLLARAVVLPGAPAAFDRRLLWRYGISGDQPLILVSISTLPGLGLVKALAQALRLWSWGGVACDLVIVNAEPASYLMAL